MRLEVLGRAQVPQVGDELVLVARRQQRGQQNHVGELLIDRRDGIVACLDQDQLRPYQLTDDVLEDLCLPGVGLYCENECH